VGLGLPHASGGQPLHPIYLPARSGDSPGCWWTANAGLLVRPEDPAGLAAAIGELYKDRSLRERLAARGRARLEQGYHATQMVAAYDDLYRRVLAETPRA
jgi:glycosyltransferase involved in cell wall biosynthesis